MSASEFAALDEQRFEAFHWRATLTTGLGVFCDGYDLSALGIVLPLVLTSFGHAAATGLESGLLAGSALIGATVGALAFGVLGQRGRKTFYGLDVLILGAAALAQAFAPDMAWLIAIRFVLGFGVGGDYVLSPVIMAEHSNRADRGRAIGLGFGTMWPVGALAAAVLALILQALRVDPGLRWRIVLAAGALPALSVIHLRRNMPETARYLARLAHRGEEAKAVIGQISGARVPAPAADERPFWSVFARHARPILAAALLWMVYDMVAYAGILFGPSLIAGSLGMGPEVFTIVIQLVFTIPPSILMAVFVIDRVGRKPLQVWGFVAMAVTIALFALFQPRLIAAPIMALIVFGLFNVAETAPGIVSGAGILGVELAPTRIRTVAQSVTVAGGRIGAALSGFVFPLIFGGLGQAAAYWILAVLCVVGAVLTGALVPETGSISLEAISEGAAPKGRRPVPAPRLA